MTEMREGRLVFRFDDGCQVGKYDDWAFYRNGFQRVADSAAVDFVCICNQECWLVEVKDYSHHPRTKAIDLGDEVAHKARDTLAGLAAARFNASVPEERQLARRALQSTHLHVVLHLEQPTHPSRLRPNSIDPASLAQKVRQKVRRIDPHPKIGRVSQPIGPWTVQPR